jgi:glycosyltransferase involved in cell wall biosynthesis
MSGTSSPRVSVILRTKNEGAYLGQVIQALLAQDYAAGLEIVVVDSGSSDDTVEIARNLGCRLIEIPPERFSFGRALNIGAAEAGGKLLVNLSGHAVPVDGDYLNHLTAPFDSDRVWATFGRDVPHPGCCPSQARDIEEWFPDEWVDRSRYFSNANACLRKTAWQAFPFDEELTGAEDAKWAQQVLAAGYQIVYVPTAAAYHSHTAAPRFVYVRAVRETKALKAIEPARAQVGLREALRFWLGVSALDYGYAWRRRAAPWWFLHIPIYRAFQAWGLYQGSR